MPDSSYTAQLRGVSGTRTSAEIIQGAYNVSRSDTANSVFVFEFEVEKTGKYKLYTDPAGGSNYGEDAGWRKAGLTDKTIPGSDTSEYFEKLNAALQALSIAIGDTAISTQKLKNSSVTEAKLSAGAVTEDKLGSESVVTAKVADDAITTGKVLNSTLLGEDIHSATIDSSKLTQAVWNRIQSSGGGTINNQPDDETLENVPGQEVIRMKDGGASWDKLSIAAKDCVNYLSNESSLSLAKNDFETGRLGNLSGGSFLSFGNLVKTITGDSLLFLYSLNNDNIYYRLSTDHGVSWGDATVLYTRVDAVNYITENVTFGITSQNEWILVFSIAASADDEAVAIYSVKSINNGSSWGAEISISREMWPELTSDIIETSTGRLILAYADLPIITSWPSDSGKIKIAYSDDRAGSWTSVTLATFDEDSSQFSNPSSNEPALGIDANDKLLMICRVAIYGSAVFTSADLGATWTYEGMIGQTLSPARVSGYNANTDIVTTQDTTFIVVLGHRTGVGNLKSGYLHILKTSYNVVHGDATFGFTTILEPTFVDADPGSMSAVIDNGDLIMVNGQEPNPYFVLKSKYLIANKDYFFENSRSENNTYSVLVNSSYFLPDQYVINNTDWATLKFWSYPFRGNENFGSNLIGAIPVFNISIYSEQVLSPDSLGIALFDAGNVMLDNSQLWITANQTKEQTGWKAWLPSYLHPTGGMVPLREHDAQIKAKTTNINGYLISRLTIRTGYVFK